eukprot:TRINITY_DN15561_c0_g1_i2.p1 TRINITY_DN15561_c0_g1~~TRINITY_DN15561_c0_g1_i2.p1  ORF type:complete len:256 (+),score=41.10 TRINITY_DN15561_c0_g1_i2:50-817(+)
MLSNSFRGEYEGGGMHRGFSGMNPRRKRKKKKRTVMDTVGDMTSGIPQEGKLGVIIGVLLLGLVWSWVQVTRQLSEVTTELETLQSASVATKVEISARAKLLLHRTKDDLKYIISELETALDETNSTFESNTRYFAYDIVLPQMSTALRLMSNLTRIASQGREYQFLERLGAKSKTGVGSPEWTYEREEEIRAVLGHPIITSTAESRFRSSGETIRSSGSDSAMREQQPAQSQHTDLVRFAIIGLLAFILVIRAL